jgi:AraC-like DNA-binding protein
MRNTFLNSKQSKISKPDLKPTELKVKKAMRMIQDQYSDPNLTMDKVARKLGISPWYLSRLFKRNVGICSKQYLKNLRMEKSEELLQITLLSVKEVAAAIGYNYTSDFIHDFGLTYGMTPGKYKLQYEMDRWILQDCKSATHRPKLRNATAGHNSISYRKNATKLWKS